MLLSSTPQIEVPYTIVRAISLRIIFEKLLILIIKIMISSNLIGP